MDIAWTLNPGYQQNVSDNTTLTSRGSSILTRTTLFITDLFFLKQTQRNPCYNIYKKNSFLIARKSKYLVLLFTD